MNYIPRAIDAALLKWKAQANRKPLLLRGARQVGKSSTIRHLGESFDSFVEINFENQEEARSYFMHDLTPRLICEKLGALYDRPIIPGQTLLFFDEIQSCPRAIQSLRYFYEDYPELHIIAAGSLLEFALEGLPSFGVGRIRSMYMYPLSFAEFIVANGHSALLQQIRQSSPDHPMDMALHRKANDLLRKFLYLGGMPAVVKEYIESGDLSECMIVLDEIMTSLRGDFVKYRQRVPESRIHSIFEALVAQSGHKIVLSKLNSEYNTRQLREGLDLLIKAGLIHSVYHTSAVGIPLGAGVDLRKQKIIFADTGILQRILGLKLADFLIEDDVELVNKGFIAEVYAGLELLKAQSPFIQASLYYWHRNALNSQAEVDYVIQDGFHIIPVEIKSGHAGKMKSLHLFLQEKESIFGIRSSLENFASYDKIKVIPLYAIASIVSSPY